MSLRSGQSFKFDEEENWERILAVRISMRKLQRAVDKRWQKYIASSQIGSAKVPAFWRRTISDTIPLYMYIYDL